MNKVRALLAATLMGATTVSAQQLPGPGTYWLEQQGLQAFEWSIDHDGDSYTAREEYAAGTDPFDDQSVLSLDISMSGGNVVLGWDSILGVVYQLLGSTDMASYSPLLGPIPGDGFLIEIEVEPIDQAEFYRLSVLDPIDEDNDGLSRLEEAMLGTDPLVSDSDRDSILDGEEVFIYGTDPTVASGLGGTIRGTLFSDPNGDGDFSDGAPLEGVTVFLDRNFNGRFDVGERAVKTTAAGDYEFLVVPPGVHHVRQELPPPNVQTFPARAAAPVFDLLPDEIVNYTHAAPGVGNFDEPYGENASDNPAEWGDIESSGLNAEPVDPALVLKPIGVRNRNPNLLTYFGSEFLTLPEQASITLRFDEVIVDGGGTDLLVYSIDSGGAGSGEVEAVEILVGPTAASLVSLGVFTQDLGTVQIDLSDHGVAGPVQFVKLISQNNAGDWFGYEFVGMEAINIASPDADAHIVTVVTNEVFNDRDFARYFRDLPPTIVVTAIDAVPATAELRAGESATVRVSVNDDIGISGTTLTVNGAAVALDANNEAVIPASNPGRITIEATTTDTGGQTVAADTRVYVFNADGTFPFDRNQIGLTAGGAQAPSVRILTPGPGTISATDLTFLADITGSPAATSWTLEYAPVDDVDPYDLAAADPDYLPLNTGSGNVFSQSVGILPLSGLPDGIYFVRLSATNSSQTAYYGQVVAKNVAEANLRPQITIDSPAPGDHVMLTTDITGTITSTRPLHDWFAEYALADQVDLNNIAADDADWKRFAEGTTTIDTSALIANFDGTMLKNNGYVVRVVARNDIGLGWAEPVPLEVTGEAKLGRNRIEFNDIEIELAGFPLKFTRVYDSIQAGENGELGFGWSLELQDADIRETVPDTGVLGLFGSTPFRDGTRVYITAPTGERLGFTFKPEPGPNSAFGTVYKATFEPDPGVYHTLEIPEGDLAFLDLQANGNVFLFFFSFPYNPSTYILSDPKGNRYTYHEDKGFLGAEDLNGNTIELNPDSISHSAGLAIDFTRDAQGRITVITDPEGQTWSFSYDAAGDLVTLTDPDTLVTTYTYLPDPAHYLASVIDPLGRMPVRYEYDPITGRVVAQIDENGNRLEVNWDPGSFTGSRTSPRGFTTNVVYDARGNVTQFTDAAAEITLLTYDDPDNPDLATSITGPDGETWTLAYDDNGNPTAITPPVTGAGVGNGVLVAQYDDLGNLTSFRDRQGETSTFAYDAQGNMIQQRPAYSKALDIERTATGQVRKLIENDIYQSVIDYDDKTHINGLSDTLGYNAGLSLDRRGRVESLTNNQNETVTVDIDFRGMPGTQTDSDGGVTTTTTNPDGSITTVDENGVSQTVMTNSLGNIISMTLPGGGAVGVTYDASRNLSEVTDPLGNTITFGYDPAERINAIADETGGTFSYTYNALGLQESTTTASGKKVSYEYDANRHLTFERWHAPDDSVIREISYIYDLAGGLDRIEDTAGGQTHLHDYAGSVEQPARVSVTYAGQEIFDIEYGWGGVENRQNFPVSVAVKKNFIAQNSIFATYYGDRLYLTSWGGSTVGGGNAIKFRHNADGTVSRIERFYQFGGSNQHSSSDFTYDEKGQLTRIRHLDKTGVLIHPDADLTYTRGGRGRIETITQSSNTATTSFDSAGRLDSVTHSNLGITDETYGYDSGGNRTTSHLFPATAIITAANRLTSNGAFTYTYDLDGNVAERTNTSTGQVTRFGYNHRNRLNLVTVHPSAAAPAATTVEFDYDFGNRLISRTINGVKTWILYDRTMPIGEFADGATELNAAFFYSLNKVDDFHAVWRADIGGGSPGERWFMKDHIGSIRGALDESGGFVSWVDYDAYGNVLGGAPAGLEPLRFAGRHFYEEFGLYENRLRFYSPHLGRFIQTDPIFLSGGDLNLYAYAGNNPLQFTDPNGTSAISYGMMVDLAAYISASICKFGNCVGTLWVGVTEGFVNRQSRNAVPIEECTLDLLGAPPCLPPPPWNTLTNLGGAAAAAALGSNNLDISPPGRNFGDFGGGTLSIIGVVDGCKGITFKPKRTSCSP